MTTTYYLLLKRHKKLGILKDEYEETAVKEGQEAEDVRAMKERKGN